MRPDKCGVLASVENNENGQYIKLTLIGETINKDTLDYFISINIDKESMWYDINLFLYNELTKNLVDFDKILFGAFSFIQLIISVKAVLFTIPFAVSNSETNPVGVLNPDEVLKPVVFKLPEIVVVPETAV